MSEPPHRILLRHILRDPTVMLAVAGFVASFAVAIVVLAAHWVPADSRMQAVAAAHDRLMERVRQSAKGIELARVLDERRQAVDVIETKLRSPRAEPEFVAALEDLAIEAKTDLLQFSSRKGVAETAGITSRLFEFYVQGDYRSLKQLIVRLRDLPDFVTAEQVVLEKVQNAVRARIVLQRRSRGQV